MCIKQDLFSNISLQGERYCTLFKRLSGFHNDPFYLFQKTKKVNWFSTEMEPSAF